MENQEFYSQQDQKLNTPEIRESKSPARMAWFIMGALAGVAGMFLLDPTLGARRRSLARDKAVSLSNDLSRYTGKTARHLRNKTKGYMAEHPLH